MKWSREQLIVLVISCFLLVTVGGSWLILLVAGESLVQLILDGQGIFAHLEGGAGRLLGNVPADQHASALLSEFRKFAGRTTTIYVICQAILLFGSFRNGNLFRDFFSAETHPLNLAILRIAYFLTLYPRVGLNTVVELSQLPEDLRVAPPGLSWMVQNLFESESTLTFMYIAFGIACLAGLIGLCTRTACITATCLTFYLMGVPQFFGKINHYHHIVWVGALLSVSRCSDVLSVDSLWSALRGHVPPESRKPSNIYALPLRFVCLFLGVLYFFPGFWKYVISGPQWFLSDNLQARMMLRMFVSEGWQPVFRADQFPLLCKIGGLTTIIMEIGFIFLIFSRWGRYIAAFGGMFFHTLVKMSLNISFWPIQAYYVAFFDLQKALQRVSNWIVGHQLKVEYDSTNTTAQRLVAAAQTLDVLGTLTYETRVSPQINDRFGLRVAGQTGWRALSGIVRYSPLFFMVLPFCASGLLRNKPRKTVKTSRATGVFAIGTVVLLANTFCGFTMIDSWPFGVYPTFARIIEPKFESLTMDAVDADGQKIADVEIYFDPAIREIYPQGRLSEILNTASRPRADRPHRLLTLWQIWQEKHPEVVGAERVNFYRAEYSTDPDRSSRAPIQRELIEVVSVTSAVGIAPSR